MKKLLAVIFLIFMMPTLALAGARVLLPEKTWDFGLAHKGGPISHPYWIKKMGDDTLRINVKPG
jgi:hypothetical protein